MCYAVYIGTNKVLKLGQFVPEQTDIYFENPTDEELTELREKFTKQNIYYVGSDTDCSCGLNFVSQFYDSPDWADNKKSPSKFIDFLKDATLDEDIEYYCCWTGDCASDIEHNQEIDIREISLDKNYFGLTEKEFIKFKQQTTN